MVVMLALCPCIIKKVFFKSGWQPTLGGCGLVDAHSGKPIEPDTLVTDEPVPMSSWELHDFAIQVVRQSLEKEGKQILSWSSDPDVNPSLWFQKGNQRAWVVVRGYKYPALSAEKPENLSHMKDELMRRGYPGYYAEVGFANADNIHKAIMRGDGCIPKYTGLQNLPEPTPKRNAMNPSGSENAELLRTNTFKNLLILGRRRGIFNGEKTASFIPDLVYSAHIIAEQVKKEFPPFVNANSVTMLSWLNVAFMHACWIGVGAAYQWRYEREHQDDLGIYEALIHKTDFSNIPLYVKELTRLDKESDFLISESFKDITKHLTQGLIEHIQQAPERLDVEILERISLAFLYGSSVAQVQL